MAKLANVRHYRERAALSQGELALMAGVSRVTIVRLERGEDAHPGTIRKVAEALKVTPVDLMEPLGDTEGKAAA